MMKRSFKLNAVASALLLAGAGICGGAQAQAAYKPTFPVESATTQAPHAVFSGAYAANARVGQISVEVLDASAPADGVSPVGVVVRVLDRQGKPLRDPVLVTIEHTGRGRLMLPDAATDEFGPGRRDADRATPGVQMRVEGGEARFTLIAPAEAGDVRLRLTAGAAEVMGTISFEPDMREMVTAGYIEGIISAQRRRYDSDVVPARVDDGFEEVLRRFSRESASGNRAAVTGNMYLKGKILGSRLLTLAYDADKDVARRLQSQVSPDQYYAVYGDASVKGFDAPSASRLYVRVDQGRSYILYGTTDVGANGLPQIPGATQAPSTLRQLGAYNRQLTGVRAHHETESGVFNAFAAQDSTRHVTDEIRANGTSGPFGTSVADALADSENVRIVARARGDLTRVIAVTPLQRGIDYVFEPFSGRLLLTRGLPSEDANGNPLSLRVDYEVAQDTGKFWVAGGDAEFKVTDKITIGGSAATDRNPLSPFSLVSANAGVALGEKTRVVGEFAVTRAQPVGTAAGMGLEGVVNGKAARVELVHAGERVSLRVSGSKTGSNFANATAGAIPGTTTVSLEISGAVTTGVNARLAATASTGDSGGERRQVDLGATWNATEKLTLGAGLRATQETGAIAGLYAGIGAQPQAGSYFQPDAAASTAVFNSPLLVQTNPVDLDRTTAYLNGSLRVLPNLTLNGEVEGDLQGAGANQVSLGASYQVAERTRLYARGQWRGAEVSQYSLDGGAGGGAFTLGVDSSYGTNGTLYSEFRMRDAADGPQQQQLSMGLRQTWQVGESLAVVGGFERLHVFSGTGQNGTALIGGADWSASERVKLTGRLELRRLSTESLQQVQDSVLFTAGLTGKLSRDWTLLARNYYLGLYNHGLTQDGWQDRFQIGMAYRPVDNNRFDLLTKYELKQEHRILGLNEGRVVHVGALQANWHPSRPWMMSARVAGKFVSESYPTTEGGGADRYRAALVGGRVTYDITENWDIGAQLSLMRGTGQVLQSSAGLEVGYLLWSNLWLSAGFNVSGFNDADLTNGYTGRGAFVRLRFKFDSDLFSSGNPAVNRALPR